VKDSIKLINTETELTVDWIHLAQGREHGNEPLDSAKYWQISCMAEQLLAFQEGFSSME
jgi:hypothetical protein